MLLVLLLGIADFGRVFQAGIAVEAATRNAAEAAAQEYLQIVRNGGTPDYDALHLSAVESVCEELQHLPNVELTGGTCPNWPTVRACIHDDMDVRCGDSVPGFNSSIPAECDALDGNHSPTATADPSWHNTKGGVGVGEDSVYVEVRTCYRFRTLFNLQLSLPMNTGLNLGDVHLQDRSVFTVADY